MPYRVNTTICAHRYFYFAEVLSVQLKVQPTEPAVAAGALVDARPLVQFAAHGGSGRLEPPEKIGHLVNARRPTKALESFKASLRRWADALRIRNMKFLILSIPVTNMAEASVRFSSKREEMFDIMRSESPYAFDFDGIAVETIVDTGKEKS